jgi:hypothetical protein
MLTLQPLSLYELMSLVISVAGFVTVIISIFLLNRSLKNDTYQGSANQMFAADQIFITYPDLRPYFYSGKDMSEDDPNYDRVIAIAEYMQDYFGAILIQCKRLPHIWPQNWWLPYFKYVFANSPVLCRNLEASAGWYQKELIDLMKEGKALTQEKGTRQAKVPD